MTQSLKSFMWLLLCLAIGGCDKPQAKDADLEVPEPQPMALHPTPEISLKLALIHKTPTAVQHIETHADIARLWLNHPNKPLEKAQKHSMKAVEIWSKKGLALNDGPGKKLLGIATAQAIYQLGEIERSKMVGITIKTSNHLEFIQSFKRKAKHHEAAGQKHVQLLKHCKLFCSQPHWPAASMIKHARASLHMAKTLSDALNTPLKRALRASSTPSMINMHTQMAKNHYQQALNIPASDTRTKMWQSTAKKELCDLDPKQCSPKTLPKSPKSPR